MKNALTQPAQLTERDFVSDAHGVPPDGANILMLAHRARKAKAAGDRTTWKQSLDELLFTARKSQLAQEKKFIDQERKHFDEIRNATNKQTELEQKLTNNAVLKQMRDLIEGGDTRKAWLIYSTLQDPNPEVFKGLGEYLLQQESIKANQGDPLAQALLRDLQQIPEDQRALYVFRKLAEEGVKEHQSPKLPDTTDATPTDTPEHPTGQRPPFDMDGYLEFIGKEPSMQRDINRLMQDGLFTKQDATDAYLQKYDIRPPVPEEKITNVADNVQELKYLISQGLSVDAAVERIYPPDKDVAGKQFEMVEMWNVIRDDPNLTPQQKIEFQRALIGNQGSGRHASALPESYGNVPEPYKHAFGIIAGNDKSGFGEQGLKVIATRLSEINANPNLTDTQKHSRSISAFKAYVNSRMGQTQQAMVKGQQDMLDSLSAMESHIRRHPSGADPNAPGFWQNILHSFTAAFGVTMQTSLSELQTMTDEALVQWIRSISGAAVTDAERAFLKSFFINIKSGHTLNRARIDGFRNVIGRRMRNLYHNYIQDDAIASDIASQIIGGEWNKGSFDEQGNFNYYRDQSSNKRTQSTEDGSIGTVEGMKRTQPTSKRDDVFMNDWNASTLEQKRRAAQLYIQRKGAAGRQEMLDAGIDPAELDRLLKE